MKKIFTTVFAMLICGTLLLTGCATPKSSLPKELVGQNIEKPAALNLIAPGFFISQDESVVVLKQQWIDEMSARYGVDINITSEEYKDGERVNNAFGQTLDILYGKTAFSGLVSVHVNSTLTKAVENGTAVPLEDYLADNAAWNALPEEFKSIFEVDGHIYAIPATCTWNMNARTIRSETLQQTGITVTDLNSLREYILALKKNPGHEGDMLESTGLDNLIDILNAYGLYMDEFNGHSFAYDPTEDCIVDFLTKGDAVKVLEYLRELNNAGALKVDFDYSISPYQDFKNGTCSTYYSGYMSLDDCTEVISLNPTYPQVYDCSATGYIMTKDTPQPKETINLFVNMLYGSQENYLDGWLGLADNYILNADGTITLKITQSEDGSLQTAPKPNLTGGLPGVFPCSDFDIKYEVNGTVTPEAAASLEKSKQYQAILEDTLARKLAIKVPVAYRQMHTTGFSSKLQDIKDLYETCIEDVLNATNWTVQQIVDDYKEEMFKMGGNKILDEMNAAIGKKTAYYYG